MSATRKVLLGLVVGISVVEGALLAQAQDPELRLDYQRMQSEKEAQAVREGTLLHLLIRHGLGLSVDLSEYTKLTKAEQAMSEAAAREKLQQVEADLSKRAAELRRYTHLRMVAGQGTSDATEPTPAPPTPAGSSSGGPPPVGPNTAAAKPSASTPGGRGGSAGGPPGARASGASPGRQVAGDAWDRPPAGQEQTGAPSGAPTSRSTGAPLARAPQPVQAIIRGSSNRGAVGRILFMAGHVAEALEELAPAEQDKAADYADLFYLARCHEELHNVAREDARAAQTEAARAAAVAASTEAEIDKLQEAGLHMLSAGGTNQSVAEYGRLVKVLDDASNTAKVQSARYQDRRLIAAGHYEKAYSLLILIEGRDIERSPDGKDVAGHWAEAARSARNMMKWIETKREWVAPPINWKVQ